MILLEKLREIAEDNEQIAATICEAADLIEELEQDKRLLKTLLSHFDATKKKFVDPENLKAYLIYVEEFQETETYKTMTYEQWFKREYK